MVDVNDDFNLIPQIRKVIEYIATHRIDIGIFGEDDSHILMIARVNEFGMTITPKNAEALTIPLNEEAMGKSPTEFNDLFIPNGTHVLARPDGDGFEPMYVLMKSVEIPERSFMRGGFDAKKKEYEQLGNDLLQQALALEITPQAAFDVLGTRIQTSIQNYLTQLSKPPNSPITVENKGSSNPLVGKDNNLRDRITYKVKKD